MNYYRFFVWDKDDESAEVYSSFDEATGTMTIEGLGGMWDKLDTVVWAGRSWGCDIKKLIVEDGVTRIGNGMFMNQYELEEVILPSTLEEILHLVCL